MSCFLLNAQWCQYTVECYSLETHQMMVKNTGQTNYGPVFNQKCISYCLNWDNNLVYQPLLEVTWYKMNLFVSVFEEHPLGSVSWDMIKYRP